MPDDRPSSPRQSHRYIGTTGEHHHHFRSPPPPCHHESGLPLISMPCAHNPTTDSDSYTMSYKVDCSWSEGTADHAEAAMVLWRRLMNTDDQQDDESIKRRWAYFTDDRFGDDLGRNYRDDWYSIDPQEAMDDVNLWKVENHTRNSIFVWLLAANIVSLIEYAKDKIAGAENHATKINATKMDATEVNATEVNATEMNATEMNVTKTETNQDDRELDETAKMKSTKMNPT